MKGQLRNKKGVFDVPIVVIIALVMGILLFFTVSSAISNNPAFKKNGAIDNSEKLDVFNKKINDLKFAEGDDKLIESHYMVSSTYDLFLFFSLGSDDIVLKYDSDENKDKNGNFIFERPDVDACDNKACLCYSYNTRFWTETEESPFVRQSGLYVSKGDEVVKWDDPLIKCVVSENTEAIFTNSRGWDKDFADKVDQVIPLEIPVTLQSETNELLSELFSKKDSLAEKRRTFLNTNYIWTGGVVIGGMGIAETKKDRKEHLLRMPSYDLIFEKVPDTDIIGVCMQEKCLYDKGTEKAIKLEMETYNNVLIESSFFYLEESGVADYQLCLSTPNPDLKACSSNFQYYFDMFFDDASDSESNYILRMEASGAATNVSLLKELIVKDSFLMPFKLPTLDGNVVEKITIIGSENDKLLIEKKGYVFDSIKENNKIKLNLALS